MTHKVIYPLSADPFTSGHKDIVQRMISLFPSREIHIIIANNRDKKHFFSSEERLDIVKASLDGLNLKNTKIILFDGILSDYAKANNADVMIRGIRNATDLDYEIKLEQFTRNTSDVETVYLTPYTEHLNTSSSLVRMFLETNNIQEAEKFMCKDGYKKMLEIVNK